MHFQKLRDKKQNNQQQGQASNAISLYYEIALSNFKDKIAVKKKCNEAKLKKDHFKLTNTDWTAVYNEDIYHPVTGSMPVFRYFLARSM